MRESDPGWEESNDAVGFLGTKIRTRVLDEGSARQRLGESEYPLLFLVRQREEKVRSLADEYMFILPSRRVHRLRNPKEVRCLSLKLLPSGPPERYFACCARLGLIRTWLSKRLRKSAFGLAKTSWPKLGCESSAWSISLRTRVEQLQTETAARFDVVNTRFDALEGGIETLQELLWPLVISLPDYPPVPAKVKRR